MSYLSDVIRKVEKSEYNSQSAKNADSFFIKSTSADGLKIVLQNADSFSIKSASADGLKIILQRSSNSKGHP